MHTYIFDMLFEMEYNKEKMNRFCVNAFILSFFLEIIRNFKNQIKYIQV